MYNTATVDSEILKTWNSHTINDFIYHSISLDLGYRHILVLSAIYSFLHRRIVISCTTEASGLIWRLQNHTFDLIPLAFSSLVVSHGMDLKSLLNIRSRVVLRLALTHLVLRLRLVRFLIQDA
jgi:hypothetical protein